MCDFYADTLKRVQIIHFNLQMFDNPKLLPKTSANRKN